MQNQASIRFDHFAYPVDDLVKAEDFYTGMLEVPNRKSTRLNSSHIQKSRMPSSA